MVALGAASQLVIQIEQDLCVWHRGKMKKPRKRTKKKTRGRALAYLLASTGVGLVVGFPEAFIQHIVESSINLMDGRRG